MLSDGLATASPEGAVWRPLRDPFRGFRGAFRWPLHTPPERGSKAGAAPGPLPLVTSAKWALFRGSLAFARTKKVAPHVEKQGFSRFCHRRGLCAPPWAEMPAKTPSGAAWGTRNPCGKATCDPRPAKVGLWSRERDGLGATLCERLARAFATASRRGNPRAFPRRFARAIERSPPGGSVPPRQAIG